MCQSASSTGGDYLNQDLSQLLMNVSKIKELFTLEVPHAGNKMYNLPMLLKHAPKTRVCVHVMLKLSHRHWNRL